MAPTEHYARRPRSFLLCGDSLTQIGGQLDQEGWVLLLQQAYLRSVDVVNRGLSGYNTAWFIEHALPRLRDELQHSLAPVLITLWLGANDAALPEGPSGHQHVPVDAFRQNLVAIVQEFQKLAPQAKIIVITPPVVDDDRRRRIQVEEYGAAPTAPIDRTNEHAGLYAKACSEAVAQLEGVALLDMYAFFMEQYPSKEDRAKFLCDGLHFSKEGNRVVYEQIKKKIESLLPTELVESWQLPDWKVLG